MSYLVLARKYRPQRFEAVVGQEHIVKSLKNSIKREKVAHAYLFTGTRGVGKTSIARIFARALNCLQPEAGEPCLQCSNCEEITNGSSLGVWEIDGASHNSVDNVRDLIETFRSLPPPNYKFKIYIVDEVHMLSTSAFNALLKSLEEPPANTVFILATTEVHKIPETILSRCQRFDFRNLSVNDIIQSLGKLVESEGIKISEDGLYAIARLADGSARDAQTLLDRVHSFAEKEINAEVVAEIIGVASRRSLFALSEAIIAADAEKCLKIIDDVFTLGGDATVFARDFVAHWRELLIAKFGKENGLKAVGLSESDTLELLRQANSLDAADMQELLRIAMQGADAAVRTINVRYALEALTVRMATRPKIAEFSKLMAHLKKNSSGNFAVVGKSIAKTPESAKVAGQSLSNAFEKKVTEKKEAAATTNAISDAAQSAGGNRAQAGTLSWSDFVSHAIKSGSPVLSEHLKRLTMVEFLPGTLVMKGSELALNYFKDQSTQEKLKQILTEFSKHQDWKLVFENGGSFGKAEVGSLLHVEESRKAKEKKEKSEHLLNHPQVKSLQKLFPGSKIERVKLSE